MARKKIALVGAGNIGATAAHLALIRGLGDVVLFDVVEGMPQGKALDLMEAGPIEPFNAAVSGTNDYADIAGADVCIVTAGLARKPGMSRDDLLATNAGIMTQVSEGIRENAPDALVIIVSNPLDAMVTLAHRVTGFSKAKVVGMAGVLDSARYRSFIAEELEVSVESVAAVVLGGHGDDMVPIRSSCTAGGAPVTDFIAEARLSEIEQRVRGAGGEVVALLKTGSAYYSPATAAIRMAEAYLSDKKEILPCAAYLEGEYGYSGFYLGVPAQIGAGGVEKIIEYKLTADEASQLEVSAGHVRELVEALDKVLDS